MDYMGLAAEETVIGMDKGWGGPFGSAVVRNGEIISVCGNTMMKDCDPSQHAEMVAIREACKKLGTMDLSDCVIYATCEPCPMCVGVIMWAGIKTCYYSNTKDDAAHHGFSDQHLRDHLNGTDTSKLNMIKVESREDCDNLFTYFHELMNK